MAELCKRMSIKEIIGHRIDIALAFNNMKQKELAKSLGVTDNTISYFIKGTRTPNTEQIIKISYLLNVSTDYLLGVDSEETVLTEDNSLDRLYKRLNIIIDNFFSALFVYKKFGISTENAYKMMFSKKLGIEFVKRFLETEETYQLGCNVFCKEALLICTELQKKRNLDKEISATVNDVLKLIESLDNNDAEARERYMWKIFRRRNKQFESN